jgi:hypothetical protein
VRVERGSAKKIGCQGKREDWRRSLCCLSGRCEVLDRRKEA